VSVCVIAMSGAKRLVSALFVHVCAYFALIAMCMVLHVRLQRVERVLSSFETVAPTQTHGFSTTNARHLLSTHTPSSSSSSSSSTGTRHWSAADIAASHASAVSSFNTNCAYTCRYIRGGNGLDGKDGENGTIGPRGIAGVAGTVGANGANGANGQAGVAGVAGVTGVAGANGRDGLVGQAGTNGTSCTDAAILAAVDQYIANSPAFRVIFNGGSRGDFLTTDGRGNLSWTRPTPIGTVTTVAVSPTTSVATFDASLGTCKGFSLLALALLTFTGNVWLGGSAGAMLQVSGSTLVTYTSGGQIEFKTPLAVNCSSDFKRAVMLASRRACTRTLAGDMYVPPNGQVLLAGVYCATAALTMSAGTLTFYGSATDEFIITVVGALDTSALTRVVVSGGALASNIIWSTTVGAVTIGANAAFVGTILANGAVTIGAGAAIVGHVFSDAAITLGAGATINIS
jgi:hypothetical protein